VTSEGNKGKTLIVTKVFDKNCDICNHMSKHDRVTFESYPEIGYQEVLLDDVINPENNARPITLQRIYQCLERYALNPDYTLDLPAYVILSIKGKYVNHHIGAATIAQLRDIITQCLEDTPE
jgi:hypothetical protein